MSTQQFIRIADLDPDLIPAGYTAWRIDGNGDLWCRATDTMNATPPANIDFGDVEFPDDDGDDDDRLDDDQPTPPEIVTSAARPQRPGFIQRLGRMIRGVPADG